MKFNVSSKKLQQKISAVSKVMLKKNALAILNYALVSQEDGQFSITASSPENRITAKLELAQKPGEKFSPFCIDVSRFLSILGTLPEQPLELEVDEGNKYLTTIRYDGGDFVFPSLPGDQFPKMARLEESEIAMCFDIDPAILLPCVKAAQSCTVEDDFQQNKSVVALDVTAEGVTVVGTDANKLYRFSYTHGVPFLTKGAPGVIKLHRSLVSALEAAVGKSETITIRANAKRIEVETSTARLCATTIDGNYLPYDRVIPKSMSYHVVVPLNDFSMIVKRAALTANIAYGTIIMEKKDGELLMQSCDIDTGCSSQMKIPAIECNLPDGFRLGFSAAALSVLLGNISTDNVRLLLSEGTKPVLLKEDAENSALTELVMPMNIG